MNDGVDGVKGEEISEEGEESRNDQHYPGDICTVSRRYQKRTNEPRRNEQQQAKQSVTAVKGKTGEPRIGKHDGFKYETHR